MKAILSARAKADFYEWKSDFGLDLFSPALSESVGGQNFRREAAAPFTSDSICWVQA